MAALERAGLKGLFAGGPVAFRRVDRVSAQGLHIDGVRLPRAWAAGEVSAGQWLRFEKQSDAVSVKVDLRATLDGEQRFNGLLSSLARGWLPSH